MNLILIVVNKETLNKDTYSITIIFTSRSWIFQRTLVTSNLIEKLWNKKEKRPGIWICGKVKDNISSKGNSCSYIPTTN